MSSKNRTGAKRRVGGATVTWLAAGVAAGLLAACGSAPTPPLGTVGHVTGFIGDVAADDPQAVEVARQVLSAGGSAADAAVALDFTLAVTLPSRASLGSGGICIVHDNPTQKTEVLDFTPKASADGAGQSAAPVAIPGNPRAMFALQSKYGHLLWEQLLAPAEKLARSGTPVSKTLGHDFSLAAGFLAKDSEAVRIFGRKGGGVLQTGDTLVQPDLGVLIAKLRSAGPGDLYEGMLAPAVARRFSEAGSATASSISANDLRDYQPDWKDPIAVAYGDDTINFAPPPAAAGLVAAEMWLMLVQDDHYKSTKSVDRAHLFAEASMRAFADRTSWLDSIGDNSFDAKTIASDTRAKDLMASFSATEHTPAKDLATVPGAFPENPAATSFVIVDQQGSAVACVLTMNNLFGLGHVARGTGIVAAMAPLKGSGATALAPMLATDKSGNILLAAGASGGAAAPAALVTVALDSLVEEEPIGKAIAEKRVLHNGAPDVLIYEKGLSADVLSALTERKHKLFEIESLGQVNAISCPRGLPKDSSGCAAATDPRGTGAAFSAPS